MIINIEEIKISFYQIYQAIFKPITLTESIEGWNKKSKISMLLRLSFYSLFLSIVIDAIIGLVFSYFGYPVIWRGIAVGIAGGIAAGILVGLELGIAGIAVSVVVGIAAGIAGGFAGSIVGGFAWGIAGGIVWGIVRVFRGGVEGRSIAVAIAVDIAGIAVGISWGIAIGIGGGTSWGIAVGIGYLVSYLRIFYILPHLIQYFRVKILKHEPFTAFQNSPIYWDEVILMPLPYLSDFLVLLTGIDRNEGLKEIEFISSKRPTQRKAASSALLEITIQDLSKIDSIKEIAQVLNNLSFLSTFEISREFSNAVRNIENISTDSRSYLDSTSNFYKLRNLQILLNDVKNFQNILNATKGYTGYKFHSVANRWYQIIDNENKKFIEIKKDIFEEIPNPYIFGTPVRADYSSKGKIFIKRDDVIREIESNLSNISQKPTLFLYGRRRVGKSSVLINLSGSLGKKYIPAYIDCQDGRTIESAASFCYSLSRSISDALINRGFSQIETDSSGNIINKVIFYKYDNSDNIFFTSIANPSLDSFQKAPFTTLGNWFDELEKTLEKENKLILINLDEYEKLEESIIRGALPITILDQLRNIIQHRKYFVVLISGSRELSELKLNWSDYLISVKTIKIGYLQEDAARTLITNPIDDFSLSYDGGANGATVNRIIDVTNCQPYLVQALCFELVNHLNTQRRREANLEDIDAAIEKVLASANVYFYYIWKEECSENEKELLLRLVKSLPLTGNEKDINSLVRREVIEKVNGRYKFKVELMKKWIEKNN